MKARQVIQFIGALLMAPAIPYAVWLFFVLAETEGFNAVLLAAPIVFGVGIFPYLWLSDRLRSRKLARVLAESRARRRHGGIGRSIIPNSPAPLTLAAEERCCQGHCGAPLPAVAVAKFGIVWDVIYRPGGSWIRETWGTQRLELARILFAAGKWHGGAA